MHTFAFIPDEISGISYIISFLYSENTPLPLTTTSIIGSSRNPEKGQ